MRVDNKPTMTWDEAPDTISPKELSKILGIGIVSARNIFDKPDFPKIPKSDIGNIGRADKEAARLYIQGVKINKKKFIVRTIELLVIIATIILTIKAIGYATLIRGYKGYGGEYLIPILGLIIVLVLETILEESENKKHENRKSNKRS